MSQLGCTAIFGVTPLSLILGRACALADRPPVGLYDPDPQTALRGALFLGISSRQQPQQLDPPQERLEVALVGHEAGLEAIRHLEARPELLILILGPWRLNGYSLCQATTDETALSIASISAELPELSFHLSGPEPERERARSYLRALSSTFRVEPDQAL